MCAKRLLTHFSPAPLPNLPLPPVYSLGAAFHIRLVSALVNDVAASFELRKEVNKRWVTGGVACDVSCDVAATNSG